MNGLDQLIIKLRESGKTCREVAEILGVSEYKIWNHHRRWGVEGRWRYSHGPGGGKQ